MSFVRQAAVFASVLSAGLARPQLPSVVQPDGPPDIRDTVCGDIIIAHEQNFNLFWASDVFDCLQNIPFIANVAARFLDYYNDTLQFQSTLEYLKNPPEGYQQPPVDVLQGLQTIRDKVDAGEYTHQYIFEADLQLLINRMHDAHVYLAAGIMAPFAFISPLGLVSASPDGKQPPAIYLQSDVISSRREGWAPSPITQINGVDVVDFLTTFAELNSEGFVEPHADWNSLMESPARDIQGELSVLQSSNFYPGDELNFTFSNNTSIETFWLATYGEAESTGPLTTAGDFYNYFVLGLLPASFEPGSPKWWPNDKDIPLDESDQEEEIVDDYGCGNETDFNWCQDSSGAYPNNPDVVQPDLAVTGGGVVTGYFLDDISTGVLSLPSFFQVGNDTGTYFDTVDWFINNATNRSISRIIIDLQQNSGGLNLLAISTFKRFFYAMEPWTASRIRSHYLADVLGTAYTEWFDNLDPQSEDDNVWLNYFAGSEWVATNRINAATGSKFNSWGEYFGPLSENGDQFSLTQLYNLTDDDFTASMYSGYHPFGYGASTSNDTPPQVWAPEDIVLLTDGLCSSACAYFVELMSQQAGVRTVVVGGRPTTGPMQTASGSRGARLYDAETVDFDIANVEEVLDSETAAAIFPNRSDTGMWVNYAGFNIRDQLREGDEERIPLQFRYEAADCRLYYTLDNVYNVSRLWRDVYAAAWEDSSLCVEDSTGYTSRNNSTAKPPPERTAQAPTVDFNSLGFTEIDDGGLNATIGHVNFERASISATDVQQCSAGGRCDGNRQCRQVPTMCPDGRTTKQLFACLPACKSHGAACSGNMQCQPSAKAESKRNLPPLKGGRAGPVAKFEKPSLYNGFCKPTVVDHQIYKNLGCPL
ncbi:hypothetical protein M011DRAFT_491159 [Sporormia fimetaria CBS 119925]|uniref:CPAF-like PDZ domain-containing protein n=1 Tax=Sporormia fimetaria CBS 119925 TaxID=1340428 RepID=A0A6A6UV91_9PLEO|nr:hypothetical protein M011DRAFT_491159 [Sporormia fimetaria CBS 119925]